MRLKINLRPGGYGSQAKLLTLIFCVSIFSPVLAIQQIGGDQGGTSDFTTSVIAKTFDRYTGTLYLGVGTGLGAGDEAFYISRADRTATAFTGIATDATVQDATTAAQGAGFLAIASTDGTGADYVGVNSAAGTANSLQVFPAAGGTAIEVSPGAATATDIRDAAGTAAAAINRIAGGYYDGTDSPNGAPAGAYFFIRTVVNGGAEMDSDCGILAYRIGAGPAFVRVGTGGAADPNAVKYDGDRGANDDGSPLRIGSAGAALAGGSLVLDTYWDPTLKTLFITSTAFNPGGGANFIMAISKVKFNDAAAAKLVISDILPRAVNPIAGVVEDKIFALNHTALLVRLFKIRTMQTSSGKWYLIVNSTANSAGVVGNRIHALRYNPTAVIFAGDTAEKQGTVAKNDANATPLVDGFGLNAVVGNSLDGGNAGSLQVGGADAPWAAGSGSATDMEVVGDTVYVSFSVARDGSNDPGIWASTAQFDENGVIIGWTAWERVFPSLRNNSSSTDQVYLFAVDSYSNKLWAVRRDNGNHRSVYRHAWETSDSDFGLRGLPTAVNTDFAGSTFTDCTCVLDLPKGTPGLYGLNNAHNSLALFGGYERVFFTRTKRGNANAVTTSVATANDFSDATEQYSSTISGAGMVRALGFSRNATNNTRGYFFAGANTGLWVFAATAGGAGFNGQDNNAAGITALNAAPFDGTSSWQQIAATSITGRVTAVDSDGLYVYALEHVISNSTLVSKLWRIQILDDIATMAPTLTLIAQSGSDGIPAGTYFAGFSLTTALAGTAGGHFGVLATSAGVMQSRFALSTLAAATTNPHSWFLADFREGFKLIKGIKRTPTTAVGNDGAGFRFYGAAFKDGTAGLGQFQDSELRLFSCNATQVAKGIAHTDFDRTNKENRILDFWSDGGRRFASVFHPGDHGASADSSLDMLLSYPHAPAEWNMTEPVVITDTNTHIIHWIENISALGIILAGTSNGVIALG